MRLDATALGSPGSWGQEGRGGAGFPEDGTGRFYKGILEGGG